ncbi:MAG: hypothetical protein MPL62_03350 [Alphaproteobacteria bacterium]|nr:hypothetical protein [Alphaproteobacteria bacterium]
MSKRLSIGGAAVSAGRRSRDGAARRADAAGSGVSCCRRPGRRGGAWCV